METTATEHGDVQVKERHPDYPGEDVYFHGRFVGKVVPRDDGRWDVLVGGLRGVDHPEPYVSRIDAITFLAGVGKERARRA